MPVEIGHVEALFRYPVKSMRGEPIATAALGWHGIEGDRRLALRRLHDRTGFPWLTASTLPELLLFTPERHGDPSGDTAATHVLTPGGEVVPVFGDALASDIGGRCGTAVEMMRLRHGIFDDATLSVITCETVAEVSRLAGRSPDVRRFRPNVLLRTIRPKAFAEDDWVGRVLVFGGAADSPAMTVTGPDPRCAMVNFDPDDARAAPEVLKAVVRANGNCAGIYGGVARIGTLAVGAPVMLYP